MAKLNDLLKNYLDGRLSSCTDLENNADFMIDAINYDAAFYDNVSIELRESVDFTIRVIKSQIFNKDFLKHVVQVFINSTTSSWEKIRVLALIPEDLRNKHYYAVTKNECYNLIRHGNLIADVYMDIGYEVDVFSIIERKLCYDKAAVKMMASRMIDHYINDNVRENIAFSNSHIDRFDETGICRILIGYLYTKDKHLAEYILQNPEILQKQVKFIASNFSNISRIKKNKYRYLYRNVMKFINEDDECDLDPAIAMFMILRELKLDDNLSYALGKEMSLVLLADMDKINEYIDNMHIHDIKLYIRLRDYVVAYIEKFRVTMNVDVKMPEKERKTSTLAEVIPIKVKKG